MSSGPSVVDLGDVSTMEVNFTDQLSALAEKNYIPLEEQFATLNKLRLVILMKDREIRRQLLSVRLFALATYGECFSHIATTCLSVMFSR